MTTAMTAVMTAVMTAAMTADAAISTAAIAAAIASATIIPTGVIITAVVVITTATRKAELHAPRRYGHARKSDVKPERRRDGCTADNRGEDERHQELDGCRTKFPGSRV
jgi:hypothetical protein